MIRSISRFRARCEAMDQLEELLNTEFGSTVKILEHEVSRTGFHVARHRESGGVERRGRRSRSRGVGRRARRNHGDWRQLQRSRDVAVRGHRRGDGERAAIVARDCRLASDRFEHAKTAWRSQSNNSFLN